MSDRAPRRGERARLALAGLGFLAWVAACAPGPPSEPPAAEVAAAVEAEVDAYLDDADSYGQVRAVLVYDGSDPVLERYSDATPEDYWDTHSVTKSVVSVLVGAAIEQGYLEGADQTLGELLPDHAEAMTREVAAITLEEVLTHTAGFEDCCWSGGSPTFEDSPDWVRALLTERSAAELDDPQFAYSEAGSHLAAAIVAEATGTPLLEFARTHVFDPLGIPSDPAFAAPFAVPDDPGLASFLDAYYDADFAWPVDPQGINSGSTSLKLRPQDLARIGQLYVNEGRWEGEQVVPASWVQESTRAHVQAFGTADAYGYLWWVTEVDGDPAYLAWGYGGQLLEVIPNRQLVVVIATEADLRDPLVDVKASTFGPAVAQEAVQSWIAPHFPAE